jgi:hypothetical protein
MSKQPEALRIAVQLEDQVQTVGEWSEMVAVEAAAELRRLRSVNAALLKALQGLLVDVRRDDDGGGWADAVIHTEDLRAARAAIAAATPKDGDA